MKLPIKWLEEYRDINAIDLHGLIDDGSLNGFVIKNVEVLLSKSNKRQIGELKLIEQHPDADQLVIIQVCVGEEETVQIVTGATNCRVGDFAPIVRKNGRIADGTKIKKGKLRGVESFGMLCSLEELGYDATLIQDEMVDNIYILNNEEGKYKPGDDFKKSIPDIMDTVLTLDFTNKPLKFESIAMELTNIHLSGRETTDEKMYKRKNYSDELMMQSMDDIESPDWLKIRLMNIGVKPTCFNTDRYAYFKFIKSHEICASIYP